MGATPFLACAGGGGLIALASLCRAGTRLLLHCRHLTIILVQQGISIALHHPASSEGPLP